MLKHSLLVVSIALLGVAFVGCQQKEEKAQAKAGEKTQAGDKTKEVKKAEPKAAQDKAVESGEPQELKNDRRTIEKAEAPVKAEQTAEPEAKVAADEKPEAEANTEETKEPEAAKEPAADQNKEQNKKEEVVEENTITTPSGLKYVDLVVGEGESPTQGKTVTVHYTGWLTDGTKFDSSVDRGQPFKFPIGMSRVIRGWDEGVMSMKVGGKRKLTIPPELGYGPRGAGGVIPPNATLVFEVELLGI